MVRKTMPVLLCNIPIRPFPTRVDWPALEQIGWERYRISHILGVIDIKPVWVESTDPLLRHHQSGRPCWKVLVVIDLTGRVIYYEIHLGSHDDRVIWHDSPFRAALQDPTNPLELPQAMKDRANPGNVAHHRVRKTAS